VVELDSGIIVQNRGFLQRTKIRQFGVMGPEDLRPFEDEEDEYEYEYEYGYEYESRDSEGGEKNEKKVDDENEDEAKEVSPWKRRRVEKGKTGTIDTWSADELDVEVNKKTLKSPKNVWEAKARVRALPKLPENIPPTLLQQLRETFSTDPDNYMANETGGLLKRRLLPMMQLIRGCIPLTVVPAILDDAEQEAWDEEGEEDTRISTTSKLYSPYMP